MHGDDEPFGSVHRVELFDKFPRRGQARRRRQHHEPGRHRGRALAGVAGRQQGAPRPGRRRTRRDQQVVDLLDDWVERDAPRLDADNDGQYDEAGAGDHGRRLARRSPNAVMRPRVRRPARRPRQRARPRRARRASRTSTRTCARCSATGVQGRFNLRYCGNGSLDACRASLWAVVDPRAADDLAASQGDRIRRSGWRPRLAPGFSPGLIPDTIRDHEPPDVPAGARVRARRGAGGASPPGRRRRARTTRGCRRRRWPRDPSRRTGARPAAARSPRRGAGSAPAAVAGPSPGSSTSTRTRDGDEITLTWTFPSAPAPPCWTALATSSLSRSATRCRTSRGSPA